MKKYVWEYFFKDEEEFKKHQARLESFKRQIDINAAGCFYILLLFALLTLGILLIVALFAVKL